MTYAADKWLNYLKLCSLVLRGPQEKPLGCDSYPEAGSPRLPLPVSERFCRLPAGD